MTRTLNPTLLAIAAASLGFALQYREGLYHPHALLWLNLTVLCTILGTLFPAWPPVARLNRPSILFAVLVLAAAANFHQLYRTYPGTIWNTPKTDPRHELSNIHDTIRFIQDPAERATAAQRKTEIESSLHAPRFARTLLLTATLAALLLSLPFFRTRRSALITQHALFLLLLGLHVALGIWLIRLNPTPHIDVWVFQQESCAALLKGENPYTTHSTNIYGPNASVYGASLATRDRVDFGFPYTPLSLYLALPGYLLAGDVRYAHLAALTLSALLLYLASKSRPASSSSLAPCEPATASAQCGDRSRGEGRGEGQPRTTDNGLLTNPFVAPSLLLLLFTPRIFMIVELAWTEPFVILGLALTLFTAARFPRLLPLSLGLFLATKQYLLFAIPLAALLLPLFTWRRYLLLLLQSSLVVLLISAPLVFWDFRAFLHSALLLQFHQPFRMDSLSYPAFFGWNYSARLAPYLTILAFPAAIAAVVVALRRLPRTPAAFAVALALTYLAFLIVNKQAFCNYYFFVLASLTASLVLHEDRPPQISTNLHQ